MKRIVLIVGLIATIGATSFAAAQAGNPATSPSSPSAAPRGAQTSPSTNPSTSTANPNANPNATQTAPSNQAPNATAPAQSAQASQQPAGKKRPEAKTQEEFQAFQQAQALQAPDALEKAADDFAKKYPNSELRGLLYTRAMLMYQQANNIDKLIDTAHKVLGVDATDPIANVFIATFIPERVRENDADRDQRYNEATNAAQAALANVDNMAVDPGAPADRVEANKKLIRSMAYAALGTVALNRKNYPDAETNLKKAIDVGATVNTDPVMYLRYSVALDSQKKYQPALQAANKAIELSPPGSQYHTLATQERTRLLALMGPPAGSNTPPAAPTPAPSQTAPRTQNPASPTQPQTPPQTPRNPK